MPVTYMVQGLTLRIQVPNNHILAQNLYYKYYYPKPKYLIIGYMDPLGFGVFRVSGLRPALRLTVPLENRASPGLF